MPMNGERAAHQRALAEPAITEERQPIAIRKSAQNALLEVRPRTSRIFRPQYPAVSEWVLVAHIPNGILNIPFGKSKLVYLINQLVYSSEGREISPILGQSSGQASGNTTGLEGVIG